MPPRNTRRIPTGPRYPRSTLPWPATSPPSWCKPTGRSRWRWPRGRRLAWPSSTSSARTARAGAGICCTLAGPTCSASWDAPPRQARRTGPRSHWTRRPPSASSSPGGSRASKATSRDPLEAFMTSVEEGIAAQIRNIEARYGKPLQEWFGLIAASGLTRHAEVVAMLKADYGMAHGAAHRVSLLSRQAAVPASGPASGPASPDEVGDALYAGKKASLRPLHDQLVAEILGLG